MIMEKSSSTVGSICLSIIQKTVFGFRFSVKDANLILD